MNYNNSKEITKEQLAILAGFWILFDGTVTRYGKVYKGYVSNEYRQISFIYERHRYYCPVHRLQAYIKYRELLYQKDIMVRHLNGNKLDNSWDNIAIGTAYDNAQDIPLNQRRQRGAKIHATRKKNNSYPRHYKKYYKTIPVKYIRFSFTFIINPS